MIAITDNKHYTDIAAAIRGKNGETTTYKPSEMAAAIEAIVGETVDKTVSSLTIYESTGMFTLTYEDGTMVTGSAIFDANGLATSLVDDDGNTVLFASGYPYSVKNDKGNSVSIMWG